MNSHNPKSETPAKVAVVRTGADREQVRVIKSKLQEADDLSISDDLNNGGDPYNSTGQHVTLKLKKELSE